MLVQHIRNEVDDAEAATRGHTEDFAGLLRIHTLLVMAVHILAPLLAPWITGRYTLVAALPSRKYVPARARAFMEFLIEQTRLKVAGFDCAGVARNNQGDGTKEAPGDNDAADSGRS